MWVCLDRQLPAHVLRDTPTLCVQKHPKCFVMWVKRGEGVSTIHCGEFRSVARFFLHGSIVLSASKSIVFPEQFGWKTMAIHALLASCFTLGEEVACWWKLGFSGQSEIQTSGMSHWIRRAFEDFLIWVTSSTDGSLTHRVMWGLLSILMWSWGVKIRKRLQHHNFVYGLPIHCSIWLCET